MSKICDFQFQMLASCRCKIDSARLLLRSTSSIDELRIPSELDNCKVISIGKAAFQRLRNGPTIKRLIIPSSVEHICESAFSSVKIKELVFEEDSSIKEISDNAFSYTGLEKLDINSKKSLTVGAFSFNNTKLKDIDFSRCKNTKFKSDCFSYSQIEKVKLHPNTKELGNGMFRKNPLKDISFLLELKKCATIPNECFSGCQISKIPDEVFKEFVFDDYAFSANVFETLELPEYANLGMRVFTGNLRLKTVVSNLPIIHTYAFNGCFKLEKVIIRNAEEIHYSAFRHCAIKDLAFEDNKLQFIEAYAFADNQIETLSLENTSVVKIGEKAFYNNKLQSVELPYYLSEVSESTFSMNAALSLDYSGCPFVNILPA